MRCVAVLFASMAAACASGASNDTTSAPEPAESAAEVGDSRMPAPPTVRKPPGETSSRNAARAAPPSDAPVADGRDRPSGPTGDGADQCGASRYHWLVGRPRAAIPATPSGENWRVTCTSCPITMDHNSARLNIFFDAETERVEEVRCG